MLQFLGFHFSLRDPIEGMDHKEFYKLNAKYKFSLAMENGLCPDYMTEKLWRPFHLGSVPIILGSPKVKVSYFKRKKSSHLMS